jgi:hypothetical protein
VIVPADCTGWAETHADFEDGRRLSPSGIHPEMVSGERLAALMECFAGARPWREHLELASSLITQYRFVSAPPDDRLGLVDGPPDVILKDLLLGEVDSIRFGSLTLAGRAAERELVRWHFKELDFRARAFARAQSSVAYLIADRRAEGLRASSLWAAVMHARLEAAAWLSAFSDEFSAGRAGFVQADVAPPAIQLAFNLESPEGWTPVEIEDLTDRFMNSPTRRQTFLTYAYDRPESDLPFIDDGEADEPIPQHV